MTEAELQDAILEAAQMFGWLRAHFRPALTQRGWRTPVSADGKGFPDLVLIRAPHVWFIECKSATGRLSPEQETWRDAITAAASPNGVAYFICDPSGLDAMIRLLARPEVPSSGGRPSGG